VLATNPYTGETAPRVVTAAIVSDGIQHLVSVAVDGGAGPDVVTTGHHLFWSSDRREWLTARSLRSGNTLSTEVGDPRAVTSTASAFAVERMYNLAVADIHTYYVMVGDSPVLVHNCGGSVGGHRPTCTCATGGPPIGPINARLAGGTHPRTGVPFDAQGFPDFSAWRHPNVPDVNINLSGNRGTDVRRANAAAGLSRTPRGYTWHHHQTCGLMQLVVRSVHRKTGHTGGFSIC
jgi:hypothetical protein